LSHAYLNLLVEDMAFALDHITITGKKLARGHAVVEAQGKGEPVVLPFARNWRTRQDSNLWPLPSEGSALSS
jgi:site-specific DNA recombinase